jgi:hypothetical protein
MTLPLRRLNQLVARRTHVKPKHRNRILQKIDGIPKHFPLAKPLPEEPFVRDPTPVVCPIPEEVPPSVWTTPAKTTTGYRIHRCVDWNAWDKAQKEKDTTDSDESEGEDTTDEDSNEDRKTNATPTTFDTDSVEDDLPLVTTTKIETTIHPGDTRTIRFSSATTIHYLPTDPRSVHFGTSAEIAINPNSAGAYHPYGTNYSPPPFPWNIHAHVQQLYVEQVLINPQYNLQKLTNKLDTHWRHVCDELNSWSADSGSTAAETPEYFEPDTEEEEEEEEGALTIGPLDLPFFNPANGTLRPTTVLPHNLRDPPSTDSDYSPSDTTGTEDLDIDTVNSDRVSLEDFIDLTYTDTEDEYYCEILNIERTAE